MLEILLASFLSCLALPIQEPDPASMRKVIADLNAAWGKARVAYDRPAMEKLLSTEGFFVQIGDRKISREDFLTQVSTKSDQLKLKRFDVDVLTVQKRSDGSWVAVIAERLEAEFKAADGKLHQDASYWITRDSYRQENGRWMILSSEAIGFERWRDQVPPIVGW